MSTTSSRKYSLFTHLSYSLKAFWLYGPGVFTVLLSYYLLTTLTQGQDVVMIMGESIMAATVAIAATTLWAFLVWYSSRLIGYEKMYDENHWPPKVLSTFPRLLAYNAFVSIQAAIVALPTTHQLTMLSLFVFVGAHNGYYFLLYALFNKSKKIKPAIGYPIVTVMAIAYSLGLFFSRPAETASHTYPLLIVAVLLFFLQMGSLYWFVKRRAKIDQAEKNNKYPETPTHLRLLGVPLTRIPQWFIHHEQTTFYIFNIVALISIGLFVAMIISLSFTNACGPLAVVLLAFGLIVGGFNQIAGLSIRLRVNWFVILLLWAWLLGNTPQGNTYDVPLLPHTSGYSLQDRPTLAHYFQKWVAHRPQIDTARQFPVYIVLADGGASRSGYWVASVLNAWQELSGHRLNDHLFCLSGASGGSVGNVAYYAQLTTNAAPGCASSFLQNDFLSYCLVHLLGTDPARHIIPFPFTDRASAIALAMESLSQPSLQGAFALPWQQAVDTSGRWPLLFINTTAVQGGTPAVVSTVQLQSFSKRIDVLQTLSPEQSLSLANATMLGARFPYVSPAGTIGNIQFVDGGYFDNSGAGVVQEMLYYLDSMRNAKIDSMRLNETDSILRLRYAKIRFHIVHITNSPAPKESQLIHPLANDLAAPLLTVFNTYATQTEVNDARLRNFLEEKGGTYTTINLYDSTSGDYPMNWVISSYRLQLMEKEVQRVKENELKKLIITMK